MTHVKICGIRRIEDARAAADAGADLVGFVFAESRRQVAPATARTVIAALRAHSPIGTVGVFVNERPEVMNQIAEETGLDYIQLSGDEPAGIASRLTRPVIRVVHVHPEDTADDLAARVASARGDIVLLDTARAGMYGGTGAPFDWSQVPMNTDRPLMVAGGLHVGNVTAAIRAATPWGVDVSGGVETDGAKDPARIHAFVATVRAFGP